MSQQESSVTLTGEARTKGEGHECQQGINGPGLRCNFRSWATRVSRNSERDETGKSRSIRTQVWKVHGGRGHLRGYRHGKTAFWEFWSSCPGTVMAPNQTKKEKAGSRTLPPEGGCAEKGSSCRERWGWRPKVSVMVEHTEGLLKGANKKSWKERWEQRMGAGRAWESRADGPRFKQKP